MMMIDTILLMGSSLFLAFVGGWYFGKAIFSNGYDDDDDDEEIHKK